MWLALPFAALVALVLAVRGKPWHGAVLVSLGVHLLGALGTLAFGGTAAFSELLSQAAWWSVTASLVVLTAVTGNSFLRRRVFGRSSWRAVRSQVRYSGVENHGLPVTAAWQTELLDSASGMSSKDWNVSIAAVSSSATQPTSEALYRDASALEDRRTGPLGKALTALDGWLQGLPAPGPDDAEPPLTIQDWRGLLDLYRDVEPGLTSGDRAALMTRAFSHGTSAGYAVRSLLGSGLATIIDQLGTEEQKSTLLPLAPQGGRTRGEWVAAGWTGSVDPASCATVVQESAGDAISLRVNGAATDVICADAASVVAICLPTYDPKGLMGLPKDAQGYVGWTCVLLRLPKAHAKPKDGTTAAERLGAHPLIGSLEIEGLVVDMDHVLGGAGGIGGAAQAVERARAEVALSYASAVAGSGQRQLAATTQRAVIGNVMASESIEAWTLAELGAQALASNAFARSAAALLDDRHPAPHEIDALVAAVQEAAQDDAGGPLESGVEPWTPPWFQAALTASVEDSRSQFDLAWTAGFRDLMTLAARASWSRVKRLRHGERSTQSGCVSLLRAWSAIQSAELRATMVPRPVDIACLQLTECVWIDLAHRIQGEQPMEEPLRQLAIEDRLAAAFADLERRASALGMGWNGWLCRLTLAAGCPWASGPGPELAETATASLISHPEVLRRLTMDLANASPSQRALRYAAQLAAASRVPIAAVRRAQSVHQLPEDGFAEVLDLAATRRIITGADAVNIRGCMAAAAEFFSASAPDSNQEGNPEPHRKTA